MEEEPQNPQKSELIYDLYGVVNHSGSISFGHYTAYCKNKHTGKWYEHNDSLVSEINESQIVSSAAYILFYERRNAKVFNVYQTHSEEEKEILAKREEEEEAKKEEEEKFSSQKKIEIEEEGDNNG